MTQRSRSEPLLAHIELIWKLAKDVIVIDLNPLDTKSLSQWTAGAHIDISVGTLGYRQYSIHSNPNQRERFSIAVLLEEDGSGSSKYIHSIAQRGRYLKIKGPRNHFALSPPKSYLFIAGSIGITPIRSMIYSAQSNEIPYRAFYLGRPQKSMAFSSELSSHAYLTLWPKDELGPFDLHTYPGKYRPEYTLIYCCGPPQLVSAVENLSAHLPPGVLNVEMFANDTYASYNGTTNKFFELVLDRSG